MRSICESPHVLIFFIGPVNLPDFVSQIPLNFKFHKSMIYVNDSLTKACPYYSLWL